jgi:hypothetical protein
MLARYLNVMNYSFKKLQLVELDVTVAQGTGNNYQFTPQTYLSGAIPKLITSIETYCADEVSNSPLMVPLVTIEQLSTSYLTLYYRDLTGNDGLWFRQIPLISLHRVSSGDNAYVRDLFRMDKQIIVWEKSFVETFPALGNGAPVSFIFSVGYEDIPRGGR